MGTYLEFPAMRILSYDRNVFGGSLGGDDCFGGSAGAIAGSIAAGSAAAAAAVDVGALPLKCAAPHSRRCTFLPTRERSASLLSVWAQSSDVIAFISPSTASSSL